MRKADLVLLGKVVRSHGREGHLKLRLPAKGLPRFGGKAVFLRRGAALESYAVESLTVDRNAPYLKLEGVDTLAQADALAGFEVFADEADFRPPGAGRYYDFEIIGCRVVTRAGAEVGTVAGWVEAAGAVLLVVRRGDDEVFIPFTEAICVRVDPEAKEIEVDPPDGLLELNEI